MTPSVGYVKVHYCEIEGESDAVVVSRNVSISAVQRSNGSASCSSHAGNRNSHCTDDLTAEGAHSNSGDNQGDSLSCPTVASFIIG